MYTVYLHSYNKYFRLDFVKASTLPFDSTLVEWESRVHLVVLKNF